MIEGLLGSAHVSELFGKDAV
jgi:hypothetical protein